MLKFNLLRAYPPDTRRYKSQKKWREDNRAKYRETRKLWRRKRKEQGLCWLCGNIARPDSERCEFHHQKNLAWSNERNRKLKLETFDHYGGRFCACCKVDLLEFLSLDHINGNGAEDRRLNGDRGGVVLYARLKREGFPPGFRVLCMNCNFALGHYGYCPHGEGGYPHVNYPTTGRRSGDDSTE